jgi:hypothetical protein
MAVVEEVAVGEVEKEEVHSQSHATLPLSRAAHPRQGLSAEVVVPGIAVLVLAQEAQEDQCLDLPGCQ